MRWPLQPLQPFQQTQLQRPFGQSVDSLCHLWFTTTNVSYRFPILKLPPPPCAVLLVYYIYIVYYACIYIYIDTQIYIYIYMYIYIWYTFTLYILTYLLYCKLHIYHISLFSNFMRFFCQLFSQIQGCKNFQEWALPLLHACSTSLILSHAWCAIWVQSMWVQSMCLVRSRSICLTNRSKRRCNAASVLEL